ncbi:MAG TPA: YdcF family protein [Acidobacteriaceae bacterium]|nr:YdcF family protein [Acidobacteriaceae bacterium]
MMSTRKRSSYATTTRRHTGARLFGWLVLVLFIATAIWIAWVYHQIEFTAHIDNAQRADAIAVFGAAEYRGRPSPVLHARLDKAVALYDRGIAPWVITLGGGSSKDSGLTEGGVGRDYLLANGVPYDRIIAETNSFDTEQQVERLSAIAARRHFRSLVVVSDGTHLFRIALLCQRAGLTVYTSPRAPLGHIDDIDAAERMLHEILSYTALRMNLHVGWLRRWLDGKTDGIAWRQPRITPRPRQPRWARLPHDASSDTRG